MKGLEKLPGWWPICCKHLEPMKPVQWEGMGTKRRPIYFVCDKC